MSELRPVTVITGASSGIGAALTREFARNDHTLVLVARRQDRMQALADEIAASGRPKPLVIVADLQRTDGARLVGEVLRAQGVEPQFIVNNAGFGLVGSAASLDREEQLQIDDRSEYTRAHRAVARLRRQPRTSPRRNSQCRVCGRFPARAGHGGLLREQGLCAVI